MVEGVDSLLAPRRLSDQTMTTDQSSPSCFPVSLLVQTRITEGKGSAYE